MALKITHFGKLPKIAQKWPNFPDFLDTLRVYGIRTPMPGPQI